MPQLYDSEIIKAALAKHNGQTISQHLIEDINKSLDLWGKLMGQLAGLIGFLLWYDPTRDLNIKYCYAWTFVLDESDLMRRYFTGFSDAVRDNNRMEALT